MMGSRWGYDDDGPYDMPPLPRWCRWALVGVVLFVVVVVALIAAAVTR